MNTITRRTALAASVSLPLLPVSAFATPGNATDTAWSAYEAAKARYATDKAARDAVEAATGIYVGISDEDCRLRQICRGPRGVARSQTAQSSSGAPARPAGAFSF